MKALVIGGTKGFGKEISQILLNKGYDLITVGRSESPFYGQAHFACDIGNATIWKKTLEKIVSTSPTIDVVIFVAGYARAKSAADLSIEDWNEHLNKNLIYVSLGLETLKNHLSPNAKIITIGSQWSIKVGKECLIPYTISKHALDTLTKDFAKRNPLVKANHYCVPTMKTPQYTHLQQSLIEQDLSYDVKEIADPAHVADALINHVMNFKKSGKTVLMKKNYSLECIAP